MHQVTPDYELSLLDLGVIEHYMLSAEARALLAARMDCEDAEIAARIEAYLDAVYAAYEADVYARDEKHKAYAAACGLLNNETGE